MRNLCRDRQMCFVSRFEGMTQERDEDGLLTGEPVESFSEPELFLPAVSMARGSVETDLFGVSLDYDRTLTLDNPNFAISESDHVWVGIEPNEDVDNWNYFIRSIARSQNFCVIAVKKVK